MTASTVVNHLIANFQHQIQTLSDLVAISSVSKLGFKPPPEIDTAAQAVARLLRDSGLENVRTLDLEGVAPYVYADFLHAPGKPTVLIYAHYDVVPSGNSDLWKTPPFEQKQIGDRLYGRGVTDDKAGILFGTAAVQSHLAIHGTLPVNVKFLIEGEEELCSPHLEDMLAHHKELLQNDVILVNDADLYDAGIPSVTLSVRGAFHSDIEVKGLGKAVHSGLFGGLVPDAALALTQLLSSVANEYGAIILPEILNLVPPLSHREQALLKDFPFNETQFKTQAGLPHNFSLPQTLSTAVEHLWRSPSLAINAIQASSKETVKNVINDTAWARVCLRIAPGMDHIKISEIFERHLHNALPQGFKLTIKKHEGYNGWAFPLDDDKHFRVFNAATKSLKLGYDKDAVIMGVGGGIPLVKIFSDAFPLAAPVVLGVGDLASNAHGENENLLISDFLKGCASVACFFDELAK